MIDLRPVLVACGLVLCLLAAAMLIPAAADAWNDHPDSLVFIAASGVSLFTGLALALSFRAPKLRRVIGLRHIALISCACWLVAVPAAALPFAFSSLHLSVVDALFEASSSITATAATTLRGLHTVPPGLLVWRALLQWLGGAGALTLAIMVLPTLQVGGMQLFRVESVSAGDRAMARAFRLTGGVLGIYAGLTGLIFVLLLLAGMDGFPALLHALSALSCGGFSTADGNIGSWHSPAVDWVMLLGMLLGGGPFMLYLMLARQRWRQARQITQWKWYLGLIGAAALALAAWLLLSTPAKPLPALRHGLFLATSLMTGSGFSTLNVSGWSGLPAAILFFLSFVGGCAASTSGGIKIFRIQILLAAARLQLRRLIQPHAVLTPSYDGQPVSEDVIESVLGFLFAYTLAFAVVAMLLALFGLDMRSALSAAAAALGNLGAALGPVAEPGQGYGSLPDISKMVLSLTMLFGRLELFLPLVLFVPGFWKK